MKGSGNSQLTERAGPVSVAFGDGEFSVSWDVSVFGGSERPRLQDSAWFDDLPVIGAPDEVRRRISACLPGVDWSDPTWGVFSGGGFSFVFNLAGDESVVKHFVVHVRGGGDAVAGLLRISVPNGWHLVDWSTGELIDPDSPSDSGWERWQAYRDKILREHGSG